MAFTFRKLEIPGVIVVEPRVFEDGRGFFFESYKYPEFREGGIECEFIQDNHSKSQKGVLRGLHYQLNPMAQGKLVRAVKGEIFDVAVDIRKGSPNYGRWAGCILSEGNKKMLFSPPGFAHGFCVLSPVAEVIYKTSQIYSTQHERGIIWNDPEIGIDWPLSEPSLSEKDSMFPTLREAENNFTYSES